MALAEKSARYLRTPWRPIVEEGDGDLTESKFSGMAYLELGETWPECKVCHQPMQLFMQLNLDELPAELKNEFGPGILQLFYCTNTQTQASCEEICDNWAWNDRAMLVRVVQPDGIHNFLPKSPVKDALAPTRITGWEPLQQEMPSYDEFSEMEEFTEEEEEEIEDVSPDSVDKLWGWPCWVQNIEYPSCPECGGSMKLVFQISSEGSLPYMFGDCGIGHITQCEKHKHVVGFGWACA